MDEFLNSNKLALRRRRTLQMDAINHTVENSFRYEKSSSSTQIRLIRLEWTKSAKLGEQNESHIELTPQRHIQGEPYIEIYRHFRIFGETWLERKASYKFQRFVGCEYY